MTRRLLLLLLLCRVADADAPVLAGCKVFPDDNIWNTPVDRLPADPQSGVWIRSIGEDLPLHEDFSSMPINIVSAATPVYRVRAATPEHDPGPYPIPDFYRQEGGSDRHLLLLDKDRCVLYELFQARLSPTGWMAGGGAVFDLKSNRLRPDGWTSADAAGLPILPGLVRYDEVAAGAILHALRFTAPRTRRAYRWPARHYASYDTSAALPPMGARFRLKASFPETGFSTAMLVIVRALKTYGIILADNGGPWFVTGEPSPQWKTSEIVDELRRIHGSDFEAVDCSVLRVEPDSGRVLQPAAAQ
jgi:hypothetical protein